MSTMVFGQFGSKLDVSVQIWPKLPQNHFWHFRKSSCAFWPLICSLPFGFEIIPHEEGITGLDAVRGLACAFYMRLADYSYV